MTKRKRRTPLEKLDSLEGNLEIGREMTERRLAREVEGSDSTEQAQQMIRDVYNMMLETNLKPVFNVPRSRPKRLFLSQVAIAFHYWDPLRVMVPPPGYSDERVTEVLAINDLLSELADATCQKVGDLARRLPDRLHAELFHYPFLRDVKRPLAFLLFDWSFPADPERARSDYGVPAVLAGERFDAAVVEKEKLAEPRLGEPGPDRRWLLLSCDDDPGADSQQRTKVIDRAIQQARISVLRFSWSEVYEDPITAAKQVHDFLQEAWGWKDVPPVGTEH